MSYKNIGGFHKPDNPDYTIYCKDGKKPITIHKTKIIEILDKLQIIYEAKKTTKISELSVDDVDVDIKDKSENIKLYKKNLTDIMKLWTKQDDDSYQKIIKILKLKSDSDKENINIEITKYKEEFKKIREYVKKNDEILSIQKKINEIIEKKKDNYCCIENFPYATNPEDNILYNKEIDIYLASTAFKKTFIDLLSTFTPIFYQALKIFPIKDEDTTNKFYSVFIERVINDIPRRFEIYKHNKETDSTVFYKLTEDYTLELIKDETVIDSIIAKEILYPYIVDHESENKRYIIEGQVLYTESDKLSYILKMYHLYCETELLPWLNIFIVLNVTTLTIIQHKTFLIMDMFTLANEYHKYFWNLYGELSVDSKYNIENAYVDDYIKIKRYFKEKIIILDYDIIENYKANDKINNLLLKDNRLRVILDLIMDVIEPIKNKLIETYNYGKINFFAGKFLNSIGKKEKTTYFLNELNTYLKYTKTQILSLIVMDLYNELYSFALLKNKIYYGDLLCILNSFYFFRIYNLSNISNLINYQSQFSNNIITTNYNPEKQIPATTTLNRNISNLYNNLYNKISGYINFEYTSYPIDMPLPDGDIIYDGPICGEMTIINFVNLLIFDSTTQEINVSFLPVTTIPELVAFYTKYQLLSDYDNNTFAEYCTILWNIEFAKLKYHVDVYSYSGINDEGIFIGTEIQPNYINICRILSYLFGFDNDPELNLYDKQYTNEINIDENTMQVILRKVNSEFGIKLSESYKFTKGNMTDFTNVNFGNYGDLNMNMIHADFILSNNKTEFAEIYTNLDTYTSKYLNPITGNFKILYDDVKSIICPGILSYNKLSLHYAYLGIFLFKSVTKYMYSLLESDVNYEIDIFIKQLDYKNEYITNVSNLFILSVIFDRNYELFSDIVKKYSIFNNIIDYIQSKINYYSRVSISFSKNFIKKIAEKYAELDINIWDFVNTYATFNFIILYVVNMVPENDINKLFPYKLPMKIINLYCGRISYSEKTNINIALSKFKLSIYDIDEDLVNKLIDVIEPVHITDKNSDETLLGTFPNLLINQFKSKTENAQHKKYTASIIINNVALTSEQVDSILEYIDIRLINELIESKKDMIYAKIQDLLVKFFNTNITTSIDPASNLKYIAIIRFLAMGHEKYKTDIYDAIIEYKPPTTRITPIGIRIQHKAKLDKILLNLNAITEYNLMIKDWIEKIKLKITTLTVDPLVPPVVPLPVKDKLRSELREDKKLFVLELYSNIKDKKAQLYYKGLLLSIFSNTIIDWENLSSEQDQDIILIINLIPKIITIGDFIDHIRQNYTPTSALFIFKNIVSKLNLINDANIDRLTIANIKIIKDAINLEITTGEKKHKYLKYKNKYLKLKKSLNIVQ
jgi:hypothetical protein